MDFKKPDLSKLNLPNVNLGNTKTKGKDKSIGPSITDFLTPETVNMVAKMLPKKARYLIGLVLLFLIVGICTSLYLTYKLITLYISTKIFFVSVITLTLLYLIIKAVKNTINTTKIK